MVNLTSKRAAPRIRLEWNEPVGRGGRTVRHVREYSLSAQPQFLAEIARLRREGVEFKSSQI